MAAFKRILICLLACAFIALLCSACTQYERDGMNPKPFNAPASWETNPYGSAFQN